MDYGHINSPRDNFDGIFDGPIVGNPEETVDDGNNTSENSQETNANIAGNRSLGNKAIRFNREDQSEPGANERNPFEVVEMSAPVDRAGLKAETTLEDASVYTGINDKISRAAIRAVEKEADKLRHGEISPAEFDDKRYAATKSYFKNTFGRDIAA